MSGMRKNVHEISHNGLVYVYPDGSTDIMCCTAPIFREPGWETAGWGEDGAKPLPAPREKGKKSEGADMLRSMRRARAKLRRLALANDFQWFVTLTLDQMKVDRWEAAAIMKTANRWLDNMVRRHGLRYILVPERHKDGAFHFHGFMAGEGLDAIDSGTIKRPGVKQPKRPRSEAERAQWLAEGGRVVYNLPQWPLGFTTAMELYGDYHAAVGYVCKYIGKQNGERPMGRWYYSGGALVTPEKIYVDLEYRDIDNAVEFSIPGAKLKISRQNGGKTHD